MYIKNRKATFDYEILEKLEVGIKLIGNEVKSIRKGNVNLTDAFVTIRNNQMIVSNLHISPNESGNIWNSDPVRDRVLLAHKAEMKKLARNVQIKGLTIVPLDIHLSKGKFKLTIALAKGKNKADKRHSLKEKAVARDLARDMKG